MLRSSVVLAMLGGLGTCTLAHAEPFMTTETPKSMEFQFDWNSVTEAPGVPLPTTDFSLSAGTPQATASAACVLAHLYGYRLCMNGTFTTGNGGTGTYITRIRNDCTGPLVNLVCDTYQTVTLTYNVFPSNNAVYTSAESHAYTTRILIGMLTELDDPLEPFSGALSGPDTGSFCEPAVCP